MKLKKLMLAALFASVFLWCTAAANNVSDINIDVTVKNDGSAVIVQHWTGIFNEGTENYIPINTGGIEVSDLAVSDEKGEYEYFVAGQNLNLADGYLVFEMRNQPHVRRR